MLHVVEHFGRAQQRLGRDAAPVEADAAEQLALDDRGLEAELRRADRGDIAAGPGAEDDEVVSVSHCFPSSAAISRGFPCFIERDEGELALRHDGFGVAVALPPDRLGLEAQRGPACFNRST